MAPETAGRADRQDGELISLDDAGLRSLSLTREGSPEMNQGNFVFGTSAVQWDDGRSSRAGDVMFAVQSTSLNSPMSRACRPSWAVRWL